jgi:hypothetical protein
MGCAANNDYSIVFVHSGLSLPSYIEYSLKQARLFNPSATIFLLMNERAQNCRINKEICPENGIQVFFIEALNRSDAHKKFLKETKLDKKWRAGFWMKTTERFFVLDEFMRKFGLKNVIHIENDTMLYFDIYKYLDVFSSYHGIAAPFDCDTRCIPCFVYFPDYIASNHLVDFIAKNQESMNDMNDMVMLAYYKNKYPTKIFPLPLLPLSFVKNEKLINKLEQSVRNQEEYANKFLKFYSIFDAASLGQYLGGVDPRNDISIPGFINETCVFDPSVFRYHWIEDEFGRKVPYIEYDKELFRVNNLHIHSKKLSDFTS